MVEWETNCKAFGIKALYKCSRLPAVLNSHIWKRSNEARRHSFVHKKGDGSSCEKKGESELEKEVQTLPAFSLTFTWPISVGSRCACLIVGIGKSYKHCRTQTEAFSKHGHGKRNLIQVYLNKVGWNRFQWNCVQSQCNPYSHWEKSNFPLSLQHHQWHYCRWWAFKPDLVPCYIFCLDGRQCHFFAVHPDGYTPISHAHVAPPTPTLFSFPCVG